MLCPQTTMVLPNQLTLGHFAVLEDQLASVAAAHAELVQLLSSAKALKALDDKVRCNLQSPGAKRNATIKATHLFDQKGGNAALVRLGIRLGVDHQHICIGTIGNPHLVAVQHVVVA